jgi:pyruvate dehydrogenase E1 component alpha subunit
LEADEPFRVIDAKGRMEAPARDLPLDDADLRELYRLLVFTREADLEAMALQRQGELDVYAPCLGQEAAQVGSAFALDDDDCIFPSYRELGAAVVRGVEVPRYLDALRGVWNGGTYDPMQHRFAPLCIPVASQILHAVGWALGARMDGNRSCALTYFGDGATSEGDFHEGCNFAAVFRVPVVLVCQNNQWAISVPLARQTATAIWRKAEGYGFPGVRVDGNDVLAVYQVTRQAVDRARGEGIPTLIEAVTYRLGPHSTADDPRRYQPPEEVERWRALDPLPRYRSFLVGEGLADDGFFEHVGAEAIEFARKVRDGVVGSRPRPLEEMFAWVYADLPPHLARQRDEALRLLEEDERA